MFNENSCCKPQYFFSSSEFVLLFFQSRRNLLRRRNLLHGSIDAHNWVWRFNSPDNTHESSHLPVHNRRYHPPCSHSHQYRASSRRSGPATKDRTQQTTQTESERQETNLCGLWV